MKIKKITKYQNKLLKLKLTQSKIYNKKHYINNTKIEDIEYRLKKSIHIIYKYHVFKKRILFLGTPLQIIPQFKKVLINTKHFVIPESAWMNGIITNKILFFKHLSKNKKITNNKISEFIFQFKKNIDLIVLFNNSLKNALNEGYLAKIPIISLNTNLNIQNLKINYKIPGDFKFSNKKLLDNFFYSILVTVLKKGNKSKKFFNNRILNFNSYKPIRNPKRYKTFQSKNFYKKKNDFYKKKKI